MAESKDWFPGSRDEQLAMAKKWVAVMTDQGTAWGIPQEVTTELSGVTGAADSVLTAAKSEATRTPVVTAHCREIFGHLEERMRDIKKRFFFVPPLQNADLIALGLHVPDSTPTPSGTPTAQVMVETYLVGRHELGLKIIYVTGSPEDKANKGYRIWYKVTGPGEKAPENPRELGDSFYTKRKKDLLEFEYEDSGKTAYMAVQIENDGKKGPWGPLVNALIP
jgi:hypothetical protein